MDSGIDIENASIRGHSKRHFDILEKETGHTLLKKGIWVYFLLLIFEGALRKWIFPEYAAPLLIVRDPVAIWLLYTAWKYNELPFNNYVLGMGAITILSVLTAITIGHGNLVVALYGARILLLHFPLIFLIGHVFDRDDVIQMVKALLVIAIPMFVLIALQFYSPQGALVNRGVGGDVQGGGFSGSLGYFRPPGTFSFTTGNSQFFGFVGVIVIYFWLNPKQISGILLTGATISLIAAIPLSISRTLFFQVCLSLLFAAVSIARKPKYLVRMLLAGIGLVIIVLLLSKASFFSKSIEAFTYRFNDASDTEGGLKNTLTNRILAGFYEPFQYPNFPFFGLGIGMGTNVGAQLLVGHADGFLISEGEWGRVIGEMGAVLGITAIVIRLSICVKLIRASYKKLVKNDLLPWMLLSVTLQAVAQGQWAQPTALGFSVMMGGLSIASLRAGKN